MDCYSCKSISGEARISPGPTIFQGEHWLIEHAYPSGLKGWLVLVLKRHAEALHELSVAEFQELGPLQEKTARALRDALDCEKEYLLCFSEAHHFKHIHVHVVPKPRGLPPEQSGPTIFSFLQVSANEAVPAQEVTEFCERMQQYFK